jgi:mRNA interferase MazF
VVLFSKNVCLIVPLTTKMKKGKFYYEVGTIEKNQNFAILSQVKLIDTKRLSNKIHYVDKKTLAQIKKAIWKLIR